MTLEEVAMNLTQRYIGLCAESCIDHKYDIIKYADSKEQAEFVIDFMYSGKTKELILQDFYQKIGHKNEEYAKTRIQQVSRKT